MAASSAPSLESIMPATQSLARFVEYVLEYIPEEVLIGLPRTFKLRSLIVSCCLAHDVTTVDQLASAFVTHATQSGGLRSALLDVVPSEAFGRALVSHLLEFLLFTRKQSNIAAWKLIKQQRDVAEAAARKEADMLAKKQAAAQMIRDTTEQLKRAAEEARSASAEAKRKEVAGGNRLAAPEMATTKGRASLAGKISTRRLQRSTERRTSKEGIGQSSAPHQPCSTEANATYCPTVGGHARAALRLQDWADTADKRSRENEQWRLTFNSWLTQLSALTRAKGGATLEPLRPDEFRPFREYCEFVEEPFEAELSPRRYAADARQIGTVVSPWRHNEMHVASHPCRRLIEAITALGGSPPRRSCMHER